jgi:lambda family phage portal protein
VSEPQLNWIDKAVSYFSPKRGLERAQARAVMGAMLAYEGAKRDRRTAGWLLQPTSGDAEAGIYHRDLRDAARDLVRNNPYASKALGVRVGNLIGTGIMAQPSGKNRRANERMHEKWKRWIDNCDHTKRHDFYGLQSLIERTRAESGECLVRMLRTEAAYEGDPAFRLLVMEPDWLDSDLNRVISEREQIRFGVQYLDNVPVAYWMFDAHPGDTTTYTSGRKAYESRPVPASDMLHIFKPLRPGQGRGVSDFAPVIQRLKALDDYDGAEVMRKKIAACLAAFVTTPAGLPGASLAPTTTDDDGNRVEQFRPGMIPYLKPGENVVVADPRPSSDYAPFNEVQLRSVAAGLGMPYELLTGDLSKVTYTSHRGGLVQFRGAIEADQWQVMVQQVCMPVTRRFSAQSARFDGSLNRETPWTYTPPRFGLLDPAKEIPAMVQALEAGIESYPNLQRREGYDWREKLDEIREFAQEAGDIPWLSFMQTKPAAGGGAPPKPDEEEEVNDAEAA